MNGTAGAIKGRGTIMREAKGAGGDISPINFVCWVELRTFAP